MLVIRTGFPILTSVVDRFEIILKLEAAGWRVATFKVGKNVIEF